MDDVTQPRIASTSLLTGSSLPKAATEWQRRVAATSGVKAGLAEEFLAICILVLSTSAFVNLFPGELGIEHVAEGETFAQVLWVILYFFLFFLVRTKLKELIFLVWRDKLYVLLLGWACLSIVWSIDRQVTIRHFIALLATSLFGVYLAFRYSLREQLRLVGTCLGIVLGASVAACLVFPSYGIGVDDLSQTSQWQGVFSHKNTLGKMAVLAALILTLHLLKRRRRFTIFAGICLLFMLVVLTQAMTALVYLVIGLAAFPFVRAFQKNPANRRKILSLAVVIFGGLATWAYYNWENLTYSLGKDPALTGRVTLWGLSMTWIWERPLLGYGYDAFWSDYYGPVADFRVASGWLEAPHAHNGLINLCLDLGLIGVILLVLGFVFAYRRAWNFARVAETAEGLWPITFLTFLFAYSLSEINFLARNDLLWVLYVSIIVGLRSDFAQSPQRLLAGSSPTVRP
jgi:exopolysaccharide production protein ExoQ